MAAPVSKSSGRRRPCWRRRAPPAGPAARRGSLLEVLGGVVDVLAGLLKGALADHLVLIGDAIDLLSRLLQGPLVLTGYRTDRHHESERGHCQDLSCHRAALSSRPRSATMLHRFGRLCLALGLVHRGALPCRS